MYRFFLSILLFSIPCLCWGQTINTEFGKNRVQYHDNFDAWWKYETQNFVTYWYGKGRKVAQSAIQLSELDHDEIQKILEHRINDKIDIIVYTDLSDLKQSNIGISDAFKNKPKSTKVEGNKIFVYFDGNHKNLRKQIRKGIANVYLNSILAGSNFQEIVQNAILLNLPSWFSEGLIAYAGSYWDHLIDDEFRDIISRDDSYLDFEKLAKDYPRVAGHSLWFYIDQMYGKSTIANLIYLTRINRKLDNSFHYILGVEYDQIISDWSQFYQEHYEAEAEVFEENDTEPLKLKNKKYTPISQLKLHSNGKWLAYVYNDLGKYKLVVRNLETGEEKVLFKKGKKNTFQETDYNYPLVAWHPLRTELSFVYEHRDVIYLRKMDMESGDYEEQDIPENFQRIHSLDYINEDDFVFAAVTDGYSDLYVYRSDSRGHNKITEDFHDDLDASYVNYKGENGILFSSNRPNDSLGYEELDTILPIQNFDLFFLKIGKRKKHTLTQITETKDFSERQAQMLNSGKIVYLSEKSGIINQYVIDNDQLYPVSNKDRNIILHDIAKGANVNAYSYYKDGRYSVWTENLDLSKKEAFITPYQRGFSQEESLEFKDYKETETEVIEIQAGQLFQSKFPDPEVLDPIESEGNYAKNSNLFERYFKDYFSGNVQEGKRVIKYNSVRASAARRTFKLAESSVKLDNTPLFNGLESYIGEDRQLTNAPVGILLKAQVYDLFQDYIFTGGARYPLSFDGSEYFLVFDRRKRLLDHRFAFYRKTTAKNDRPDISQFQKTRRTSWLGMYRISYPFDIYRSIRLTSQLRFDKAFSLVIDAQTFNEPIQNEKRIGLKAEYIYDNSFDVHLNIKNGTRYKAYLEIINQFNLELTDFNVNFNQGFTTVIGFDARHYIPVLKDAVLALRGAGASSLGSKRMLYYVGGVENWIGSKFDENIPLPESPDFAYRVLAPNLRGFDHNIRNGSNYILGNAELRLPIFHLLGMKKIRLAFLKNMQFIAFADTGMAWFGWSPYGEENKLNKVVLETPPVITTTVEYFRDPLVYGYGWGLRTTLLGYFLKFDYARGVETRFVQDPKYYFSIGYDF